MKRRISETYHFDRNDARDSFIHGQLHDTLGILGGPDEIAGDDERVHSALHALHEGFTTEQFLVATLAIMAAFERRAMRHTSQGASAFSIAVLEQTSVARRRFLEALREIMEALGEAETLTRDGFEKFRAAVDAAVQRRKA